MRLLDRVVAILLLSLCAKLVTIPGRSPLVVRRGHGLEIMPQTRVLLLGTRGGVICQVRPETSMTVEAFHK